MTDFDKLIDLPNEEMGVLVWGLTPTALAIALKTSPQPLKDKFFDCMSLGAGRLIEDMMGKLQDLSTSQIEEERGNVLKRLQSLRASGEIPRRI